jgi:cellulase (glycosyl hydrolase family 5)
MMRRAVRSSTLAGAVVVGLTSLLQAQTFVPFHSGVNLSVAPGGQDKSSLPLATQQAQNTERVEAAHAIGFDFIRLRVPIASWTDTGNVTDQQIALALTSGIINQALSLGMRVDVVMMPGTTSSSSGSGLICSPQPAVVAAWTEAWQQTLALLPDSPYTAFEPLSEPPNCSVGRTDAWTAAQFSLYQQVRARHRATKFVVYGYHWGDNAGTNFTRLDPTSYATDPNTLYTFHYYDPFAFTAQGLAWMGDGHYKYETGVTWPYDPTNTSAVLGEAITLVRQDQYLTPDQQMILEDQISADLTAYATTGTLAYLTSQFAKVQVWARAYHLSAGQILVGEYGVAQPSHNTLGTPLLTSPAWLGAVNATAHRMWLPTAVWDLDSGHGIVCGTPGTATLCPAYQGVFP